MNFLTDLGKQGSGGPDVGDVGVKILACNPVLESFGNSKTVRNDNSSRFGKYVLMYFALVGDTIYGARIKNYLLEKSRVIKVAEKERGYHVFYFMLRGMEESELKALHLCNAAGKREKWETYNYIKTGGDLTEKHDVEGWIELKETVDKLGFTKEQANAIWRCCAVVLLLGQIDYDKASFAKVEDNIPGKIKNEDVVKKIT